MRIVVRQDDTGGWRWTLLGEDGRTLATSTEHVSRSDVLRAIAELKVEGPFARVVVEDVPQRPASSSARP